MGVSVEGGFVQRDGKTYYNTKDVNSFLSVSYMKVNVDNGLWAKRWTIPTNLALNADWKVLKNEIDKNQERYISIVRDIVTPLLNNVAVEDIYEN